MNDLIQKKCIEIAKKHAEIIEEQCKEVCDQYDVAPENLVIEYQDHTIIKIKINVRSFSIENSFIFNGGIIKNV